MENECEEKFREWLDSHEIPYWFIAQGYDTFSKGLKKYMGKRPDFMILVPNFGFLVVDVEDHPPSRKYSNFQIEAEETKKYSVLQRLFNLPVWYAFSTKSVLHYETWYWVAVSTVMECKILPPGKGGRSPYYIVPLKKCAKISSDDSLTRLFEKMLQKEKGGFYSSSV